MLRMQFFQFASSDVLFFFQNSTEDDPQYGKSGTGYDR